MSLIVDTSALIALQDERPASAGFLDAVAKATKRIVIPAPALAELLTDASAETFMAALHGRGAAMVVEFTPADAHLAARVHRLVHKAATHATKRQVRVDTMIFASAINRQMDIVTEDLDFQSYRRRLHGELNMGPSHSLPKVLSMSAFVQQRESRNRKRRQARHVANTK